MNDKEIRKCANLKIYILIYLFAQIKFLHFLFRNFVNFFLFEHAESKKKYIFSIKQKWINITLSTFFINFKMTLFNRLRLYKNVNFCLKNAKNQKFNHQIEKINTETLKNQRNEKY